MEKHAENKKDTQPFSSVSAKKTWKGKQGAAFECSNIFYGSKGTDTGIHFLSFFHCPQRLIAGVT